MNTLVTSHAGTPSPTRPSGLVYKVGLGVIATGVIAIASSWILGGIVFVTLMALLRLLGAPEQREILSPSEPEAGGQILQLFGGILCVSGVLIISLRYLSEFVGLAGKTHFTGKLSRADKLGLGATAFGFFAGVSGEISRGILDEIFLHEDGWSGAMAILETVGYIGAAILLCGLAILLLGGVSRQRLLLGWTNRVGWGKLGHAWINKLGLGLIVLAIIGGTFGLEEQTTFIAGAGIAMLLFGFITHFLSGGRP